MASTGSDTVIVVVDRKCAKQMLLALTLALGGTPVKQVVQGKKGKGKSGGGKAATSTTSAASGSTKSATSGGKLTTATTSGGKTAKKKK